MSRTAMMQCSPSHWLWDVYFQFRVWTIPLCDDVRGQHEHNGTFLHLGGYFCVVRFWVVYYYLIWSAIPITLYITNHYFLSFSNIITDTDIESFGLRLFWFRSLCDGWVWLLHLTGLVRVAMVRLEHGFLFFDTRKQHRIFLSFIFSFLFRHNYGSLWDWYI